MIQWLARQILNAIGWQTFNAPEPAPHGIMVIYPHTSNWDFPLGLLWKFACNRQPRWVAKDTLFRWPFGGLMRRLGGLGICRAGNQDVSTALKTAILKEKTCWLGIAIEGTRSRKDHVHMSYFHIAHAANLPIGIAVIDYANKVAGVREYRAIMPTIEEELAQLAIDFAGVGAKYPEKISPLRIKPKQSNN